MYQVLIQIGADEYQEIGRYWSKDEADRKAEATGGFVCFTERYDLN